MKPFWSFIDAGSIKVVALLVMNLAWLSAACRSQVAVTGSVVPCSGKDQCTTQQASGAAGGLVVSITGTVYAAPSLGASLLDPIAGQAMVPDARIDLLRITSDGATPVGRTVADGSGQYGATLESLKDGDTVVAVATKGGQFVGQALQVVHPNTTPLTDTLSVVTITLDINQATTVATTYVLNKGADTGTLTAPQIGQVVSAVGTQLEKLPATELATQPVSTLAAQVSAAVDAALKTANVDLSGLPPSVAAAVGQAISTLVTEAVAASAISSTQPLGTVTATATTTGNGAPTAVSTAGTASTATMTATATATTTATGSGTGSATHLSFSAQPSSVGSAAPFGPVVVQALDDNGNVVTSYNGSVTIVIGANPASGTLGGSATLMAAAGVATFSNLTIDKAASGYTLVASSGTLATATSAPITVAPAMASRLAFSVQPTTTAASTAISPAVVVQALDPQGNLATGYNGTVTVAVGSNPSASTLGGTLTVAASAGVATFANLNINNDGNGYTLVASSGLLTSATSSTFNIFGIANHLVFAYQPMGVAAGAAIAPAIQVQALDQDGLVVPGFSGTVTIAIAHDPSGNATLSGTTSVNATSGVATFSTLSINNSGAGYTLTASSSDLASATSAGFDIMPYVTNLDASALNGSYDVGGINALTTATWTKLSGTHNGTLHNFNYNTAGSGWQGSGTTSSPYLLQFDGSNDYVSLGSFAASSYSVWFNASTIDTNQRFLFDGGRNCGAATQAYLENGNLYAQYDGGTTVGAGVTTGSWNHLVLSDDGTTTTFYLNGIAFSTAANGTECTDTRVLGTDQNLDGSAYFKGSIAEYRAYSRALTATETMTMYTEDIGRFTTIPASVSISRIESAVGAGAGGATVTILGWHFTGATAVSFGGANAASFTVVSDEEITATVPAGRVGDGDVVVTTGGGSATIAGGFNYTATPTDSSIVYLDARDIDGAGASGPSATNKSWMSLDSGAAASLNKFTLPTGGSSSGWDGSGTPASPYRLKFDGATNYVGVGSFSASSYSVWFNPSTIDANQRFLFDGGRSCGAATQAYLENGNLYAQYNGGTTVGAGVTTGSWSHLVLSDNGVTTTFYLNGIAFGTATNGTECTDTRVLGTDQNLDTNAYFAGAVAELRAYSRALTATEVMTMYTEDIGRFATATAGVGITRIEPAVGSLAGGASMTILGWHFTGATGVTFGGVDAASFTVVSDEEITATTPAGSAGYDDVVVTTGGGSATATAAYRYTGIPTNGIVAYFDGQNIDSIGTNGSSAALNSWTSLASGASASLNLFTLPTGASTSGWDGNGSVPTPYRLKFDGAANYVGLGDFSASSYAIWFNASTIDTNQRYILDGGMSCGAATQAYVQSGKLYVAYYGSTIVSTAVSPGTWYQLVMSNNGTTTTFYLNGASFGSKAAGTECYETRMLGADENLDGNSYFAGAVGEFFTYSRALSGAEVSTIYSADSARY